MNWKTKFTAAALSLFVGATAGHAATVTADAGAPSFEVGESVSIALNASTGTEEFTGFQTLLSFDETLLSLQSIAYHSSLDFVSPAPAGPFTNPDLVTGGIGVFATPLSGDVLLATLVFEALAVGDTVVTFGDANSLGGFLADTGTGTIFDGTATASVSITAPTDPGVIPLPASALLLLSGLFGLRMAFRKRA